MGNLVETTIYDRCNEHLGKLKRTRRLLELSINRVEEEIEELSKENTEFAQKRREIRDQYILESQEKLLEVDRLILNFESLTTSAKFENAESLKRAERLIKQLEHLNTVKERNDFRQHESLTREKGEILQLRMDRILGS